MSTELSVLRKEHVIYVEGLKVAWLSQNRMRSKDVYEVMRPEEQAEVHRRIEQWKRYITPLAESWWKERGYGVVWPDDDSKPMHVYKLETA